MKVLPLKTNRPNCVDYERASLLFPLCKSNAYSEYGGSHLLVCSGNPFISMEEVICYHSLNCATMFTLQINGKNRNFVLFYIVFFQSNLKSLQIFICDTFSFPFVFVTYIFCDI